MIRKRISNAALFTLLILFYGVWPVGTLLGVSSFWLVLAAALLAGIVFIAEV